MSFSRKSVAFLAVTAAGLLALGIAAGALIFADDDGDSSTTTALPRPAEARGYLGLSVTANSGVLHVATVEPNGPAAAAGIQTGDIIRSVDGQIVRTPEQLRAAAEAKTPGSTVTVTYERGDREAQARVTLAAGPAQAQIASTPTPAAAGAARQATPATPRQLGVRIEQITPSLKQRYSLTADAGVVITQVQPGSLAETGGIRLGDVLIAVNGRAVSNSAEATLAVQNAMATTSEVNLRLLRGSTELTLQFQGQGASPSGIDELPARIQELLRNGVLTPEQQQQLQRLYQGLAATSLRLGTIRAASDSSVTIAPLDGGAESSLAINDRTELRRGGDKISASDLRPGMTAFVVSLDGVTATAIVAFGTGQ